MIYLNRSRLRHLVTGNPDSSTRPPCYCVIPSAEKYFSHLPPPHSCGIENDPRERVQTPLPFPHLDRASNCLRRLALISVSAETLIKWHGTDSNRHPRSMAYRRDAISPPCQISIFVSIFFLLWVMGRLSVLFGTILNGETNAGKSLRYLSSTGWNQEH